MLRNSDRQHQASPTQRDRWLGAACAELAVAYAESLTMSHGSAAGVTFLTQLRAHFPRHVAFRGELDTANSTLSVLPATAPRHR
ncbi:MAG TPA: hypothetical protein VIV12_18130 [Streptosporangiaceae bacterium]